MARQGCKVLDSVTIQSREPTFAIPRRTAVISIAFSFDSPVSEAWITVVQ